MRVTLDTTVIVKALVEPRRAKDDSILKEQTRLHKLALSFVTNIQEGKDHLYIPSIALVETASVISRLTGSENLGKDSADFVIGLAHSILYDVELLDVAVAIATHTKASGFDVIFLACCKLTNSTLVTDDIRMHRAARSVGIPSQLLREL